MRSRHGRRGLVTLEAAPYGALVVFGLVLLGFAGAWQISETEAGMGNPRMFRGIHEADWLVMLAPLVLVNAAVAGYGAVLAWRGAMEARRWFFWVGILLVASVATARFFEYTEGLLVKSLVFLAAGAAVIVGGVKFEKFLRARRGEQEKEAPRE